MTRQTEASVEDRAPALLVYSQEHPLHEVRNLLLRQGVETSRVRDCAQAAHILCSDTPPVLVFAATDLPDGTWEDIVDSAGTACHPAPVIVVSHQADVRVSNRVWESGAAGFLAPPFSDQELARVVRSAMLSGFLASPLGCDSTEGLFSNAENHVGSGVPASQA
jgi:FixJ family two-component response regulator